MTTTSLQRFLSACSAVTVLLLVDGCAIPSRFLPPAATREGRWLQDLDYLAHNLPRLHKNAFHTITRDEFSTAVQALRDDIDSLGDHQIIVRMTQIVASVGDGHTRLGGWDFGTFPLRFSRFPDGAFLLMASRPHADALGSRVVSIDETSVEEALKAVATVIPHDNNEDLFAVSAGMLAFPQVLHALGISRSPTKATFELEAQDGTRSFVEASLLDPTTEVQWQRVSDAAAPKPLSRRNAETPYWYEHLVLQR